MANFNNVPTIHASRSRFDLSHSVKTSANVGTLYPVYVQEIYPGDTFKDKTSFVARLTSSYLRPVMDNLFMDIMFFFVPSRLVFDDFTGIFGENKQSAWAQSEPVFAPVCETEDGVVNISSKSVCDYLGLPVGEDVTDGFNIIPIRSFAKIYDDWFRDENLIDPMLIHTGDFVPDVEVPNNNPWSPSNYFGMLPKVAKFHDVFTSALPSTQKASNPVDIPIGDFAPVRPHPDGEIADFKTVPMRINTNNTQGTAFMLGTLSTTVANGLRQMRLYPNVPSSTDGSSAMTGWNMYADLADAGLLAVPDLRLAFQLQRILERSARSGTRYTEYLMSAFGVKSPDARLQRSEYLGGKRMPLSTQQVAQTTRSTEDDGALGSLGAFSLSNGQCGYTKGFVEHGFVIGVMCIRQHHTYQQGIEKFWQRNSRFDYYDPCLANISEQPVYVSELFAQNDQELKGRVFGYQEAWYDLRYRPSYITGDMRTDSDTSLDIWHFGDYYRTAPVLTQGFISETADYVDRTIAVPSTSVDQFIVDIYHEQSAVRRLPTYSIPGLIDHH